MSVSEKIEDLERETKELMSEGSALVSLATPEVGSNSPTIVESLVTRFLPENIVMKLFILEDIGVYSIDDFVYLEEEHLSTTMPTPGGGKASFKTLEISAILTLQAWLLQLEDINDWKKQSKADFMS